MFVFASLKAEHLNWPILEKVSKLTNLLDKLAASIRRYNNHRKSLFVALILSFLHHFAQSLTVYYFVIAVSPEVSFLPIIFVSLLAGFLIMIPISLNGLGIQEGTYIFYLEQLGVAAPNALIIALLVRAAILIFSLIGGFLSLIHDQGLRKVPENNNTSVNKT